MKEELIITHNRIKPFIHFTPVLTSNLINEITGVDIFFKCENFQKMGAFKMRGALNAIMQLTGDQKLRGVVTHSSGNFAQALALAARNLQVTAYIVMPSNAPAVKKQAVVGYKGIVEECEPTLIAREETANKIVEETGATFVHPYNDLKVILGQGTAAMELLEIRPDLEYIFSPIGGGGLVSGTIFAAKAFGNNCKVVGAEPENVDDAYRSIKSGKIENNSSTDTIADGLKTSLGEVNFSIIKDNIHSIITVKEKEIVDAMRLIWERLKIVVEPSGAVPLAALFKEKQKFSGKKVGIILSGGNVDLSKLPF